MNSPFVLNDLPDNSWSVSWPGHEYHLVDNPRKAENLLGILFDTVKVNQAQLAVRREGWSEDKTEILHVDVSAWWQDKQGLASFASDFIVLAIKFCELSEAEHFKQHMEQRLAWRRLGGKWN